MLHKINIESKIKSEVKGSQHNKKRTSFTFFLIHHCSLLLDVIDLTVNLLTALLLLLSVSVFFFFY